MSLYYPDKTIALTFVDVMRLLPKAAIRNFYDLRKEPKLMKSLAKRFDQYISEGGVYFNSDGQTGKSHSGRSKTEIPPSTYYLTSLDVIKGITGVTPVTEEELMNQIVPDTKVKAEGLLK